MTRQGIKELALANHVLNQGGWGLGTWPQEIPSMTSKKQHHTKQELAPSLVWQSSETDTRVNSIHLYNPQSCYTSTDNSCCRNRYTYV